VGAQLRDTTNVAGPRCGTLDVSGALPTDARGLPSLGGAQEREVRQTAPGQSASGADGRLVFPDVARGVAIVLVVLGHVGVARFGQSGANLLWHRAVVAVNMPLFFFVSGYLLYKPEMPPWLRVVRQRAARLLVPYVSWLLVACAIVAFRSPEAALQRLGAGAIDPWMGLWFLYVLFECIVLFALLHRLSDRSWWLIGSTLAVAVAITLLPPHETTMFGKTNVQHLLPYLALGFVFARNRGYWRDRVGLLAGVAALGFGATALTLVGGDHAWWRTALAAAGTPALAQLAVSRFVRYLIGVCGVTALFAMSCIVRGRLARVLALVGVSSLGVYAIHGWVMTAAERIYKLPVLVTTVIVVGVSVGLVALLRSWPLGSRLLLGVARARPSSDEHPA
jgi:fucose 4-O-acetylase-like acetyltransferase